MPRARRLPPSFPNKCNRSPRRPRRQQDRASTPPKPLATMRFRHRGVPETKCRNTTPHPTHPARHPRHESDGRVAQGPDAASRDQKTNHNPHRHETPPIGPHSHQRPPHTPFAALHVYNGQYKDHRQFSAQWFCGIISIYLNHSARQIRGETMMVSSTRQLDWMWWSRRPHESEMSYRSSPDGVGPQSELAVLLRPPNVLDAPRRARVSPVRSNRAASRPSLTPNGICRAATTHLALDGLPSFQRRGSPDSWCVDDVPCRPRRPKMSGRADKQRQAVLRPFIDGARHLCPLRPAALRAAAVPAKSGVCN